MEQKTAVKKLLIYIYGAKRTLDRPPSELPATSAPDHSFMPNGLAGSRAAGGAQNYQVEPYSGASCGENATEGTPCPFAAAETPS